MAALFVDRAPNLDEIPRDFKLKQGLKPGSRLVIVGDPGSGKTTLLQWLCLQHGTLHLDEKKQSRPTIRPRVWLPILLLCRDFAAMAIPETLSDLLQSHFKQRQYSDTQSTLLVEALEKRLEDGTAMLLFDGLDELPSLKHRKALSRLIQRVAGRYSKAPMVISSRVGQTRLRGSRGLRPQWPTHLELIAIAELMS